MLHNCFVEFSFSVCVVLELSAASLLSSPPPYMLNLSSKTHPPRQVEVCPGNVSGISTSSCGCEAKPLPDLTVLLYASSRCVFSSFSSSTERIRACIHFITRVLPSTALLRKGSISPSWRYTPTMIDLRVLVQRQGHALRRDGDVVEVSAERLLSTSCPASSRRRTLVADNVDLVH